MKSLNSKDYLFITFVGFLLGICLVIFGIAGSTDSFFYLLLSLAIVLAVANPVLLFWLFIATIPFEATIVSPEWFPFSLRAFQLFGIVGIFSVLFHWMFHTLDLKPISIKKICLVCRFLKKQCKVEEETNAFGIFDRMIFLLPIFAFLGIINAPDKQLALKLAVILVSFVALFWLIRTFTQTKKRMFETLWFFAVGSAIVLLFGFYQAFAGKFGLPSFEVFDKRINGTFLEPDWFGMYLSVLMALILWFRFALLERKDETMIGNRSVIKLLRIATIGDLFLLTTLLILTVARSAWLGFSVALAFYLLFVFIRKKGTVFSRIVYLVRETAIQLSLIFVAVFFVWITGLSTFHIANRAVSSVSGLQKITISCQTGSSVPEKIDSIEQLKQFGCFHIDLEEIEKEKQVGREVKEVFRPDPNIDIRKKIYLQSWEEIKKHPILGQGIGSSGLILGHDEHGSAHNASNIFLESWLSMGIGGLVVMLFVFFYPLFWALKNLSKKEKINSSVFVVLTSFAVLIPNLFNSGLLLGAVWLWIAIIAGVVGNREKRSGQKSDLQEQIDLLK